jgi:trehalose synthase
VEEPPRRRARSWWIVDQIVDGETGLLVEDPHDLEGFGGAIERLLRDPFEAERLGREARIRVERQFLGDRHLLDYCALIAELIDTD